MCLAGVPCPPPPFVERMKTHRQERLMMTTCVLEMLSEDEQRTRRGRILGSKNIRRIRKSVESMRGRARLLCTEGIQDEHIVIQLVA